MLAGQACPKWVKVGDTCRFEGRWTWHDQYGLQVAVDSCDLLAAKSLQGGAHLLPPKDHSSVDPRDNCGLLGCLVGEESTSESWLLNGRKVNNTRSPAKSLQGGAQGWRGGGGVARRGGQSRRAMGRGACHTRRWLRACCTPCFAAEGLPGGVVGRGPVMGGMTLCSHLPLTLLRPNHAQPFG